MVNVCFIVDVPGWSLDAFVNRIAPHMPRVKTSVHHLYKSLQAALSGGNHADYNLPAADIYYCTLWTWLAELVRRDIVRSNAKYIVDVVDDYSWTRPSAGFAIAAGRADAILTQSVPFLLQCPTAVFHPFPASPSFLARPRQHRKGRFKIGMVANGVVHSTADHKGVALMRSVHGDFVLEVAGLDRLYAPEEMPGWYDTLDAYCCLSLSEGFSAATVDALSLQVPVIGTPVSPLHPFVGPEGYYRVERKAQSVIQAIDAVRAASVPKTARACASAWAADRVAEVVERQLMGLTK